MILGIDLFFSLFNNLAIFIALVGVYGYLVVQFEQMLWYKRQLILGMTFGMFAIGCMYAKIPVFEGVIVDQRNAIIALSGFFGGPLAAYISAAFAGAFRLYLGGQGAFAGVVGVTLAATAGALLRRLDTPFGSISKAATSAFLATLLILPGFLFVKDLQTGLALMESMSGPYGLAIFLGIFIVGLLLHREDHKIELGHLLRESEKKFKALAETSPLAIYMSEGVEQKGVYMNPTFTKLFGYTLVDIPTVKQWWPLAYPDAQYRKGIQEEWQIKVAHAIETKSEIEPMETVVTCKDGSKKTISWGFISTGKQDWSCGLDLTERKEAMEEVIRYRDKLQVLVEEQTLKLKQAQSDLLQQERLTVLGKVTATVSHELRNPLGTVQASLFSIEDCIKRNEPHQAARSLELAERSIARCVDIIEDLNDYTRVKKLEISKISVDDWLETVINDQNLPEEISCQLDLNCKVPVSFDQGKLRQVMINLITNSLHALQDKQNAKASLRISTQILDDEYEIRIYDNGIGMSEETEKKIFEPLYSTKGFGVGLGMVIVKNLVEQHHGKIKIESKPGEGTVVALRLPVNLTGEQNQIT